MFIAMNRFSVNTNKADVFVEVWRQRESFLKDVPGFIRFHLLQGGSDDGVTLFSSHVEWRSRADFEAWTQSEAFRKAHAGAGKPKQEGIYAAPPKLELFESVLSD